MGGLSDHFGGNAADRIPNRYSRSFLRSIQDDAAPMRISETASFVRKHDSIPARMVRDNTKVRSFSNCSACHVGAEKGAFDEDAVRIPDFGSWED